MNDKQRVVMAELDKISKPRRRKDNKISHLKTFCLITLVFVLGFSTCGILVSSLAVSREQLMLNIAMAANYADQLPSDVKAYTENEIGKRLHNMNALERQRALHVIASIKPTN